MTEKLILTPISSGYVVEPGDEMVSVELDGGEPFYRRDKEGASSRVAVRWQLTPKQYNYIQAFYRTTIKGGSEFFYMDLVLERAAPADRYLCHFVPRTYKLEKQQGLTYWVTAQLDVRPTLPSTTEDTALVNEFRDASGQRLWLRANQGVIADYSPFSWLDGGGGPTGTPLPTVVEDNVRGRVISNTDVNGYISYPFLVLGSPAADYTFMVWYRRAFAASTVFLVTAAFSDEIQLLLSNTGLQAGHNGIQVGGGVGHNNVWAHAAMVWRASGTMSLYDNGGLVDTAAVAAYNPVALTFRVGGQGGTDGIVGRLDDAQFIKRAFTDGEIQTYYQNTLK